jgi:hypothetical protein
VLADRGAVRGAVRGKNADNRADLRYATVSVDFSSPLRALVIV